MAIAATRDVLNLTGGFGPLTSICAGCGRTNSFNTPTGQLVRNATINGTAQRGCVVRCQCGHRQWYRL